MLYITMMQTQISFPKVKDFFKNQLSNSDSIKIIPVKDGFAVNQLRVRWMHSCWKIQDKRENTLNEFFSKKLAVLAAALLTRNKKSEVVTVKDLDTKISIYLEDRDLYERLTDKHPENPVYQARLSKVNQALEILNLEVRQLEKLVNLQ